MKTVGLRELKNQLSLYVRLVRAGEVVVVTDRGDVVAELVPPHSTAGDEAGLAALERKGELIPALPSDARKRAQIYRERPPIPHKISTQELLEAERGKH